MLFGIFLAVITVFVWGISFICTKTLMLSFSPLETLFFRYLVAYAGLWIIRPKFEKVEKKDILLYFLAGLSGIVVYQFSENIAVNFTSASNVSVIVSITPLFTAIIAQFFLKEKNINVWFIIGFVISIIGVALVSLNGSTSIKLNPKGDLIALAAAISWGFYSLCVSLINKKDYDLICSTRRIFFFALITLLPIVLFGWNVSKSGDTSGLAKCFYFTMDKAVNSSRFCDWKNIVCLCFLGLLASGLSFCTWNKACAIVGTVKVSKGLYLIPVVTIIVAAIVLHESLSVMGLCGAALTIVGLFISSKK
ncbi:MAG: DMT family transporter [Treponema sp.]|nr:DMT family transporter [Candidatus Treponema scatequi]